MEDERQEEMVFIVYGLFFKLGWLAVCSFFCFFSETNVSLSKTLNP